MISVDIHHEHPKGLIQWTRNDGTVYYSLKLGKDVTVFVDSIDDFITEIVALKEANLEKVTLK